MPHSKQRYLFIDLLRFLAVLLMIQGHTFDASLNLNIRQHEMYFLYDFFHGLVAPMFLFASGVAFGISTLKKWEEHIVLNGRVAKRIGRFIGLLVIGYALHLPFFSFTKIVNEATETEIAAFLQVDALHCIAVTLLALQIIVLAVRTEKRFILTVGILAAIAVFLSPIVWSMSFLDIVPLWLVSYLNAENNSWFPLFPWSGYILSGVLFSRLFMNAKEHRHAVVLMKQGMALGVLSFIVPLYFITIPFDIYPLHDVWKANPLIFVSRIGFIMVVTGAVFFAEHRMKIRSAVPQVMGRESLFIYILHLVILYGSVMNKGLQQSITSGLTVIQSFAIFLLIAGISALSAFGWHHFKKRYRYPAIAVQMSIAGIFIFLFMTRPY
jgi:uncharacterized membrane protein